jgi:hypothetical protein
VDQAVTAVFARRRSVLIAGGVSAVLIAASVPLSTVGHQFTFGSLSQPLLMIPFAAVGALVASRQPRNPIGWILLTIALTATLGADSGFYAVRAYRIDHHGLPLSRLAVFLTQGWVSMLLLLPLPILLFPDGRVSRRWRWTLWAYGALSAVLLAHLAAVDLHAFTDHPVRVDASGELKSLGGGGSGGFAALGLVYFAISLSWVIRQLVVYRKSTGDRRQQLKWLMAGGAVAVFGFGLAIGAGSSHSAVIMALSHAGFMGLAALPVGIGIGILRYRLYDIDRLISRTLSYALLTGLLVGIFAGLVILTTRVLPFSNPVGVAASTLAAAALFSPLRGRLQRVVDRRFNRTRYDAEALVAAFGTRLRDAVDPETVLTEFVGAATRSLHPAHASVWVKPPAA